MRRREWPWILAVGALSLLLNCAIGVTLGVPRPRVHDEFSYLLAADTFAHGRLTNPTHPMWTHFESMHVIQTPTYQSKYPPGKGLALAAGQALAGHPIAGVWLTAAAASAAVVWMLRAALPLPWAVYGGLLAALHPLVMRWSRGYWGGLPEMLAGALLLGALERVIRRRRPAYALVMGLGMGFLAITRPYEGAILSLLALIRLGAWALGRPEARLAIAGRAGASLLVALLPAVIWLGYYAWRVTGHAATLPPAAYAAQYQIAPTFVWQRTRATPPAYRHEAMRAFHTGWELETARGHDSVSGFLRRSGAKVLKLSLRYSAMGVLLPLLLGLACAVPGDRRLRASAAMLAAFTGGVLAITWDQTHYAAPAFALLLLLAAAGARRLWRWQWRGRRVGRVVVAGALVMNAVGAAAVVRGEVRARSWRWTAERARVVAQVSREAPRSLVIVRYGPRHSPHAEWVYNAADIDRAPIVWARAMSPAEDQALVDYFADRRVWRLDVDDGWRVILRAEPARTPTPAGASR